MHIVIRLFNGQGIHLPESWPVFQQKHVRQGNIFLDGEKPNQMSIIPLTSVIMLEQIPDEIWEEQRKAAIEQVKQQQRQHSQAEIAKWRAQPWFRRVGRKCPYTLPPEPAQAQEAAPDAQAPVPAPGEGAEKQAN